jgi:CubicO group peptidase (beta-lactamase class C family)
MRLALLRGSFVAIAFAAALAVSAQSLRPASPESVGMSAERLERLSDALESYVADGRLAGSVTLVARRGRIAYF